MKVLTKSGIIHFPTAKFSEIYSDSGITLLRIDETFELGYRRRIAIFNMDTVCGYWFDDVQPILLP